MISHHMGCEGNSLGEGFAPPGGGAEANFAKACNKFDQKESIYIFDICANFTFFTPFFLAPCADH